MIPDTELRLSAMLRAMQNIVLPAIPADNQLAIEQASLIIGNLVLLQDQGGREAEVQRGRAAKINTLAKALINLDPADARRPSLDALAAAMSLSPEEIAIAIEELILAECHDEPFFAAAWPMIMASGHDDAEQGRNWFKATGMW